MVSIIKMVPFLIWINSNKVVLYKTAHARPALSSVSEEPPRGRVTDGQCDQDSLADSSPTSLVLENPHLTLTRAAELHQAQDEFDQLFDFRHYGQCKKYGKWFLKAARIINAQLFMEALIIFSVLSPTCQIWATLSDETQHSIHRQPQRWRLIIEGSWW